MKQILVIAWVLLCAPRAIAQIPYFAGTVGDGKLYGYSSVKVRPGINRQETYTTFQYGVGDHVATGIDLYTGPGCAYWGALGQWNVYLWGNDLLKSHPRVIIGIDFAL
ncbi:MAG: hypothetical protein E7107_02685 [Prevotella sp.]|jgi:hypothetical protein|nr:hypothetical protein [Prevotella sp.]